MERRLKPFRAARGAAASRNVITALSTARIMVLRRVTGLLMLSLCSGQTTTPSPSPLPSPCSAPPGFYCSGGSALICPIGAWCAGGSALNVSCYPVTACTVAGLSAQPPCYGRVDTLAGSGALSWGDGAAATASFNSPYHLIVANTNILVADQANNRVRNISFGFVTTIAGSGVASSVNGVGTSATLNAPRGIALDSNGNVYISEYSGAQDVRKITVSTLATSTFLPTGTLSGPLGLGVDLNNNVLVIDSGYHVLRSCTPLGVCTILAGGFNSPAFTDAVGISARFNYPRAIATTTTAFFVADGANNRIRLVTPAGGVSTVAGSGAAGSANGLGVAATFSDPRGLAIDALGYMYVADRATSLIRLISPSYVVSTIAGSSAGFSDGFGRVTAMFSGPCGTAVDAKGVLYVADTVNNRIRSLQCAPCPATYYCFSGAPVLCPSGSYCPVSSINATLCPQGSYSNAGASNCTLCPAGTLTSATGSPSCQQCPGGHYCPAGTSSWARLNCGRGSYCPDGSGAPTPCPYQVPPTGGWGALLVQGPAFLVETAHCRNHCFWNFTSGDGMLSKC